MLCHISATDYDCERDDDPVVLVMRCGMILQLAGPTWEVRPTGHDFIDLDGNRNLVTCPECRFPDRDTGEQDRKIYLVLG